MIESILAIFIVVNIVTIYILDRKLTNMEVTLTSMIISLSKNTPILPRVSKDLRDRVKYYTDEELWEMEMQRITLLL